MIDEKQSIRHLRAFVPAGGTEDLQLWIIIEFVSQTLDIDYRKPITVVQGEALWNGIAGVINKMLQQRYVAFSFSSEGRVAWPEQAPKQVLARVKNKWIEYKGKFPDVGFIVWFHNAKDNKDCPMK